MLLTSLRDVPARLRSMRAVFDHSWRLLNEEERGHVAVFRGGWMAEAAVQVAGARLPALAKLVDKSLVRQSRVEPQSVADRAASHTVSEPRFVMLEPIREYGLERLGASSDAEAVRRRHVHYFTALAEAAATQWDTPMRNVAIAQQRREHDNMRAALQWACDTGDALVGLRLAQALWGFWRLRLYQRGACLAGTTTVAGRASGRSTRRGCTAARPACGGLVSLRPTRFRHCHAPLREDYDTALSLGGDRERNGFAHQRSAPGVCRGAVSAGNCTARRRAGAAPRGE